jgi:hypothetical protein
MGQKNYLLPLKDSDGFLGFLRNLALNPIITAALLAALYKGDAGSREALFEKLKLQKDSKIPVTVLRVLLGLGVLKHLNKYLTRRANNNWVSNSNWEWSKEIAVVTGGSSGIGELVVKDLAGRGIKAVALDVNPPKNPLRKFGLDPPFYLDHDTDCLILQRQMHTISRQMSPLLPVSKPLRLKFESYWASQRFSSTTLV